MATNLGSVPDEAIEHYHEGVARHRERCLSDAMRHYEQALSLAPAHPPTADEVALMMRHAPRVFTTPTEPLPLKDAAAILHPEKPFIGYHLFFEDDIDFPANGDPCDHEVVWVQLDEVRERVTGVIARYHHVVITSPAAVEDAEAHDGRPRFDVQWGKHGPLPYGWQEIEAGRIRASMHDTFQRLTTDGCRRADHPLARHWPDQFAGTWEDFVDFSHAVDVRTWLQENQMLMVGHFANAIIDWFFLRYNFFPKYSWPNLEKPGEGIL